MQEQAVGRGAAWYRRHRWVVDPIGMALLAVVLAALGFRGIWSAFSVLPDSVSPWWSLALALPACALALVKQRVPMTALALVAVLFVADLLTVGGLGTFVVLLDVFWTAAFLSDPRQRRILLVLLGAATAGLFLAAMLFAEVGLAIAFIIALQFGAIFGTDYWWAVAVSQANELTELHRQRADEAAAVAERDRAEAVRRERETMARELHDVVAGHVLAMAIRAEAALSTVPDHAKDRDALQAVRDAGLDAHAALRSMISVLRRGDGALSPTPRWEDLDGLVAEAQRAGLHIRFTREDVPGLGGGAEQAVVRVVREALSNCVRHANGAEVDVAVEATGAEVVVTVRSRGGAAREPDVPDHEGWGLQMLRERVVALGGAFTAGPEPTGWSVEARVPREVRA